MAGKKKSPEAALPAEAAPAQGTKAARFSKEQLAASKRFQERRDMLEALLKDGELYTVKDAEEKMEGYMKGKVR